MSCGGALTGMLLTAGASLLQNSGLTQSLGLDSAVSNLTDSFPGMSALKSAVSASGGNTGMISMGGLTFPGIADAVPNTFLSTLGNSLPMTELIGATAEAILGDDLGVFAQHLTASTGFVSGSNDLITSLADFASEQFAEYSQNSLMTGALADVNKALPTFATDLANAGNIINLGDLNNLGNPLTLVKNLSQQTGGIGPLNRSLLNAGIDPTSLTTLLNSTDVGALTTSTLGDSLGTGGLVSFDATRASQDLLSGGQTNYATLGNTPPETGLMSAVYSAMANVQGEDLNQVQAMLGSNVSGLTSMQDMLDPSKVLPNSYPSLASVPKVDQQAVAVSTISKVYV